MLVILNIPSVKQGAIEALGGTDKNVFDPIHAILSNRQLRSMVQVALGVIWNTVSEWRNNY